MGRKTMIAIHQLLEKRDKLFWQDYWNDNSDVFENYPQFIEGIAAKIIESSAKRIFIIHEDRAFFLAGFLAAHLAGITLVLPHTIAAGALQELMQPDDVILKDILEKVTSTRNQITKVTINPDVSNIIFFTSGTTAKPKEVVKSLSQLEKEIEILEKKWGADELSCKPRFFSTVSHAHIYGLLFSLLWPVSANYKIFRKTFSDWTKLLEHHFSGDYLVSSPSLLERNPHISNKTEGFNKIFSSGSNLEFEHAKACEKSFGILPLEVYGSTETGGIAYRQQFQKSVPWKKFDCITIKTNKENHLSVQSPYILDTDFYETNDCVSLLNNSSFHLLGRTDRIVKIEGKRVSLSDVEERLCRLDYIENAKIIFLKDNNRDALGAAIILSEQGRQHFFNHGKLSVIKNIKNELKNHMEMISIPRRWRFLEHFPSNSEGKLTCNALEQYFLKAQTSC